MAKPPIKEVLDRRSVVEYVCRSFEKASVGFGPRNRVVKGTDLYDLQVDMAYLIDEIERGPEASAKHAFSKAKRLVYTMTEGE